MSIQAHSTIAELLQLCPGFEMQGNIHIFVFFMVIVSLNITNLNYVLNMLMKLYFIQKCKYLIILSRKRNHEVNNMKTKKLYLFDQHQFLIRLFLFKLIQSKLQALIKD